VLEAARLVGVLLAPIPPDFSSRLLKQLDQPALEWSSHSQWGGLSTGVPLPEPQPLLQRLELEQPL